MPLDQMRPPLLTSTCFSLCYARRPWCLDVWSCPAMAMDKTEVIHVVNWWVRQQQWVAPPRSLSK
jgi:hypothetical protein